MFRNIAGGHPLGGGEMLMSRSAFFASVLVPLLTLPALAGPEDYIFRNVADSSDGFTFLNNAAINNTGLVAFNGSTGDGQIGIYTGRDPLNNVFADNSG